jgi:hypothetical protein
MISPDICSDADGGVQAINASVAAANISLPMWPSKGVQRDGIAPIPADMLIGAIRPDHGARAGKSALGQRGTSHSAAQFIRPTPFIARPPRAARDLAESGRSG